MTFQRPGRRRKLGRGQDTAVIAGPLHQPAGDVVAALDSDPHGLPPLCSFRRHAPLQGQYRVPNLTAT